MYRFFVCLTFVSFWETMCFCPNFRSRDSSSSFSSDVDFPKKSKRKKRKKEVGLAFLCGKTREVGRAKNNLMTRKSFFLLRLPKGRKKWGGGVISQFSLLRHMGNGCERRPKIFSRESTCKGGNFRLIQYLSPRKLLFLSAHEKTTPYFGSKV